MRSALPLLAVACLWVHAGSCASTPVDLTGLDPDASFAAAKAVYDAGDYDDAVDAFDAVAAKFPKSPRAEDSRFYSALSEYRDGDPSDAFKLFKNFATDYPVSAHLPEVEETLFQIGLDFLDGRAKGFLGIFSAEGKGVEVMEYVLTTFPRGRRGIDAQRILAHYYFQDGDWIGALAEYQQLSKNYPRSEWKPVSDFRIGLCYLEQSRGWEYDRDLLTKARATFEGYVHDFPEGANIEDAKRYAAEITETLAEKDYRRASLYLFWEQWTSARIFLEDVARTYPGTEWAERARIEIARLDERLARERGQDEPLKAEPAGGNPP